MTVRDEPLTRRERQHAATVAEIKDAARRLMAAEGAAGITLRAVARELGMTPSALYRYFDSHHALLTALIVDSFNELGDRVEGAVAGLGPEGDAAEGFLVAARAFRAWAVGSPHEFALLYGSPVPGYDAPEETKGSQLRTSGVLLGLLVRGIEAGQVVLPVVDDELGPRLRVAMAAVCGEDRLFAGLPPAAAALALTCWSTLLGAISVEVFGHLPPPAYPAADELFELAMRRELVGLGFAAPPG